MGAMQRRKGQVGERELAKEFARLFGVEAYRAQQFCGAAGDCDVFGLPGVHVESKRTEKLRLYEAVQQAVADAKDGNIPVVFHRANGKPWLACVRLDDLPALASKLFQLMSAS